MMINGIPEKLDSGCMAWISGLWMHGFWMLGLWTPGRLDSGRLDAWTLDAWTQDVWTLETWTLGIWTIGLLDSGCLYQNDWTYRLMTGPGTPGILTLDYLMPGLQKIYLVCNFKTIYIPCIFFKTMLVLTVVSQPQSHWNFCADIFQNFHHNCRTLKFWVCYIAWVVWETLVAYVRGWRGWCRSIKFWGWVR